YGVCIAHAFFAPMLLAVITLVSFLALGIGFVATLVVFFIVFHVRIRSTRSVQSRAKQLLKATLLSLRGIATVTFIFLVITAIYEFFLRIVGDQPPFFLLAALVTASMYVFILADCLFAYAKEFRGLYLASRKKEEH